MFGSMAYNINIILNILNILLINQYLMIFKLKFRNYIIYIITNNMQIKRNNNINIIKEMELIYHIMLMIMY